jgi:hypothetical protein
VMAGVRKIAGAIKHDRDLTVGRSASWTWLPSPALTLVNFSVSNARRRLEAMPVAIGSAPHAAAPVVDDGQGSHLDFQFEGFIRAIDSATGSTVTTRNVCSLPLCPLMETYSPGKNACAPNL